MSLALAILLLACALVLLSIGGLLAAADAALAVTSKAELLALGDDSPRTGKAIRRIAEDEGGHVEALSFARVFAETVSAVLITVALA